MTLNDILAHACAKTISEFGLDQPMPDLGKMSDTQRASYRAQAKLVLNKKPFQEESKRIIAREREILAFKCISENETAYHRGMVSGIKALHDALMSLASQG